MVNNNNLNDNSENTTNLDIELLKTEVAKYFPIYDMRFNVKTALFFCRIDEDTLNEKFESLRVVLKEKGYIPMIRFDQGEHIIYIIRKPKLKIRSGWINFALLIATIFTTTYAGAWQWVGIRNQIWIEQKTTGLVDVFSKALEPSYMIEGFLFFSIPLLLILGIHEMGHYLISKKHRLDTSLPYFIPLPPPFILGTFGAIISTREPIPNRKTLLDVGVSGPIFGFLVAIPVCLIGLFFMQQNPIMAITEGGNIVITFPLALRGMESLFNISENALMHPTLFAGWVGLFLTSLNLLPVGQLDGGHVSRALFKQYAKYASWIVIIAVLGLGLFYTGWFFIAIIILMFIGTQHSPPLNEYTPLDIRRKILGIIALIIFIICFAPIPMSG
ncbi:MAG: site-2 protease family protein [Thermoplasmatales archaeon]|nr:MAG: site-2 protease family protein [Thermoplasmatales archaeon]